MKSKALLFVILFVSLSFGYLFADMTVSKNTWTLVPTYSLVKWGEATSDITALSAVWEYNPQKREYQLLKESSDLTGSVWVYTNRKISFPYIASSRTQKIVSNEYNFVTYADYSDLAKDCNIQSWSYDGEKWVAPSPDLYGVLIKVTGICESKQNI